MILADTTVWIDHFRATDPNIERLVDRLELYMHPFVIGELAMGSIADRQRAISAWREFPMAKVLRHEDLLALVEQHRLYSRGIGYTDANLLASVLTTSGMQLWTRDKRLFGLASEMGVAARVDH